MKKTDEKIFSEGDFNSLKKDLKKENVENIKIKLEKQKQFFINRGKIKMLDELFNEFGLFDKEKVIRKYADVSQAHTDEEFWKGLTLSEKILAIKDLIQWVQDKK